ncbi:addiction module antitoxin, RelB/DinJ family protein [Janthinobacterium agaricidamnosum NBRC 102515 = DSM 9628]|uniref:Addiction module antitoxin, RelB/DinJ family protein n=1 Tax=Janthinobacterium agaricidamnosum NBRC 102515 = DSM 9628 TaxID=1349767 RepID=W0V6P8_9BURK|nr:addiction module antitoxin, RelB/DinJ family protein [Janthinobacterium agaricidamnosum NBRC 102515 = DSM 9628]
MDEEMKLQAHQTLAAMGMTVSDAVRLFLHRVVADQAIPFELKVSNGAGRVEQQGAGQQLRALGALSE